MSCHLFGCVFAGALAFTAAVAAQEPKPYPPADRSPAAQDQARTVTVEGCLMREADVPGRKPNIAERAGIAEDYILTSTKMVKGKAPATTTAQARPGDTPTGTTGMRGLMYEVEGIEEDKLKQHAGRRVQIDGTFENVDRAQAPADRQTPTAALVQIRGTALRQVAGECPPKQ